MSVLKSRIGEDTMPALSIAFKDTKLVGWSKSKQVWRFKAGQVLVDKSRVRVTFQGGIDGELLKDNKSIAKIRAGKVIYNVFSNDVYVPDAARFEIDKGPSVQARNLYWNARAMQLASGQGVDATLDVGKVHGESLKLDLAKKEITLNKVNGTIVVE